MKKGGSCEVLKKLEARSSPPLAEVGFSVSCITYGVEAMIITIQGRPGILAQQQQPYISLAAEP